jgi:hypothetical protein
MAYSCPEWARDRRTVAKPRVHEIAAELGIESKQALEKLKEMGEFVKGPVIQHRTTRWRASFALLWRPTA